MTRDLARIDRMAHLMDAQFHIPLTGVRLGLDGIVGIVPVVGDLLAFAPSAWIIGKGWQHGARRRVLLRMAANSGIDLVIGMVPLVGDLFDIGYKANLKNARLLRRELERR
ncbi:DUF4112 domain-containing protein [Pelagivirga sediminicola]|uniref:DUF4112 domain-containing protein n=1 Tax=Pelagivirga sediminicola TaxID=2170575 RepID=UPI001FAEA598|nr:DUF4112 domain-containing protein [Pelagivirga sediminicola]